MSKPYPHPIGSPFHKEYVSQIPMPIKKAPPKKSGRPPGRPRKNREET